MRRIAVGEAHGLDRATASAFVRGYEISCARPQMRLETALGAIDHERRDSALRRIVELCWPRASNQRAANLLIATAERLHQPGSRPTSDAERMLADVLRAGPLPSAERLRRILAGRNFDRD